MLQALRHLLERGRLYRDIKPANTLVRNDDGKFLDLVVADYGLMSIEIPVSVLEGRGEELVEE